MIHLLRGPDHEFVVARRLGVAVREDHFFVVPHDMVDAKALGLGVIELPAQGHKEGAHLLAEGSDLFFAVIRAPLLQIAHGDIVLIAEIFAHLIADADQFIPDLLQARLVILIKFRIRLDGGSAHGPVGMLKVFLHAVEVQRLAVEGDLRRGHDLLILIGQAALLLAQRDIFFTEQLFLQIHGNEILPAKFFFDLRTEGAGRDGLAEGDLRAAGRGQRVLQIMDLRFVKRIAGVQRVANVCDGILREKRTVFPVHFKDQCPQRFIALRLPDRSLPFRKLCAVRLQVGALVFQGRKSVIIHSVLLSPLAISFQG